MRGMFVTGTDTGVGKTRISCGLLHGFARAGVCSVGMKPVASGAMRTPEGLRNDDALVLQQHAAVMLPYEWINPYVFEPPIAPHIAASEVGVRIELPVLLDAYAKVCSRGELVVVEGVGGWQVPLAADLSLPELARALGLPVIMVVGMRLGCLNHALLTARAIQADGLQLAGWIANQVDPEFPRAEQNLTSLRSRLPAPLLGEVPYLSAERSDDVSDCLATALQTLA
ncbi:MAG: dethiobiotin synthase [bacterium]